jgi:endonuclease/exonuclease/phosphatase family metal-dependent hydrolase
MAPDRSANGSSPMRSEVIALGGKEARCRSGSAAELSRQLIAYPHSVFYAAQREKDGGLGSAFLARTPLTEIDACALSRKIETEDSFSRIVLHTCYETRIGAVHLFNAHFSWVAEQGADNLREAADYLESLPGRPYCLATSTPNRIRRRAQRPRMDRGLGKNTSRGSRLHFRGRSAAEPHRLPLDGSVAE